MYNLELFGFIGESGRFIKTIVAIILINTPLWGFNKILPEWHQIIRPFNLLLLEDGDFFISNKRVDFNIHV